MRKAVGENTPEEDAWSEEAARSSDHLRSSGAFNSILHARRALNYTFGECARYSQKLVRMPPSHPLEPVLWTHVAEHLSDDLNEMHFRLVGLKKHIANFDAWSDEYLVSGLPRTAAKLAHRAVIESLGYTERSASSFFP